VQTVNSSEAAGSGLAGVDLDEDRLRLLQLQKSYQAAAKFLQIAQTKLDTLVQTMRVDNEDRS
jgi:flagellar hook-associated protein FlgK